MSVKAFDMASSSKLLTTLECQDIAPGEALPVIPRLEPSVSNIKPSEEDQVEARTILIQIRKTDPTYTEVKEQTTRNHFRTATQIENRTNTDNWDFKSSEIGRGLDLYFSNDEAAWKPVGVAQAILNMDNKHLTAAKLWEVRHTTTLQRVVSNRIKRGLSKSKRTDPLCPWLDRCVAHKALSAITMLCKSGMSQQCINSAIEKALRNHEYDIANELLRFQAKMPCAPELYTAALSSPIPDDVFIRLWQSAPLALRPDRQFAIDAMTTAICHPLPNEKTRDTLSLLLANTTTTPEEKYLLLTTAIVAVNIEAIAALSVAAGGDWSLIKGKGTTATNAAVKISCSIKRYRILHFLFSAGVTADTIALRKQLFRDANSGNLDHVRLLVRFGVSAVHPGRDINTLVWAVENVQMDVFDALMDSVIPLNEASTALGRLSLDAAESDKAAVILSLCQKGATGTPLDRLLLDAVRRSSQSVIDLILRFEVSVDYVDDQKDNSFHIAVQRGNATLARQLCKAKPSALILSNAVELAFEALVSEQHDALLKTLSVLAEQGASGEPVQNTIVKAIPTPLGMGILKILVPLGMTPANAGRAIMESIKLDDCETLRCLCENTDVPKKSLEAALLSVLYGRTFSYEKGQLLAASAEKQGFFEMLDAVLVNSKRNIHEHNWEIMDMFLSHGASVDAGNGVLFVNAIRSRNLAVFQKLLGMRPNISSLTVALRSAIPSSPRDLRLSFVRSILDASNADLEKSSALLKTVQQANPEPADVDLIKLLLEHGASVNHSNGEVMHLAAQGLLVGAVDVLLANQPSQTTVDRAFQSTLEITPSTKSRLQVLELLLKAGVTANLVSRALIDEVKERRSVVDVLALLLKYGADVNTESGLALAYASMIGSAAQVELLVNCGQQLSKRTIDHAFAASFQLPNPTCLSIVQILVTYGVDSKTRSESLLDATRKHSPQLLAALLCPADILWQHDRGSLKYAISRGFVQEVRLFLRYGVPRETVRANFDRLVEKAFYTTKDHVDIAAALLQVGLDGELRNSALTRAFNRSMGDLPIGFINLLLESGANADISMGQCFGIAAMKGDADVFRLLASRPFNLNHALWSLINVIKDEAGLDYWVGFCITEHKRLGTQWTRDDNLLIALIEHFPEAKNTLARLLDEGYHPGCTLRSVRSQEIITLLMWTLESDRVISDDVILELLSRGEAVNAGFTADISQRTAAHLAAFTGRDVILQRLIELGVEFDVEASEPLSTPLCLATALGHTPAMKVLLEADARPETGSLHISARRLDEASLSLLKSHGCDLGCQITTLSGRTPLAELCYMAQAQSPVLKKRVRSCMRLLEPFPDETVKFDGGKTILHLAIDNSNSAHAILEAFLELSNLRNHPNLYEAYLFQDTMGLWYSPTKYVEYLCERKSDAEKATLIELLKQHRFSDRFFSKTLNQPPFACGIPEDIAALIREEERKNWKHRQQMNRDNEMAAQQYFRTQKSIDQELAYMGQKATQEIEIIKRRGEIERSEQSQTNVLQIEHLRSQGEMQLGLQQRQQSQHLAHVSNINNQELETHKMKHFMNLKADRLQLEQRKAYQLEEAALTQRLLERAQVGNVTPQARLPAP